MTTNLLVFFHRLCNENEIFVDNEQLPAYNSGNCHT